ncbi:type IV pilus modification protein PilV [Ramlibacter sp. WS9]|uniref:type IV pilus modification protein PilV n=1 Tax=Ramlibacter sp. WS9 TaxID=1882741 RepID=UPI0011449C5B|nr:type IV pilus modification protein PilV [Ramlibacter sp. WS9]ROZ75819.1 type IV pilus modification protein PilV [Ramlibacter sp. WS9]
MKHVQSSRPGQSGATLIEVLVSILILMFGLLGLVGVMVQSQRAQLESFQREQALLIAQDMVARMLVNKGAANCYVTATYLGVDETTVPDASACAGATVSQAARFSTDIGEWLALLEGSGEKSGSSNVGGVPKARGCITKSATTGIYQVSVVWQGSVALSAPPGGITCGLGLYNSDTTDTARRAVALTVLM